MVSNGVVMQDAVAPAMIPPVACTKIIFDSLGVSFMLVPWPSVLQIEPEVKMNEVVEKWYTKIPFPHPIISVIRNSLA